MTTRLIIDGFKAFSARFEIPLNRLTLIFGANSSGKSSIIHALLALHHAATTREASFDIRRPLLSPSQVDLGGFGAMANHRRHGRTTLGLAVDWKKEFSDPEVSTDPTRGMQWPFPGSTEPPPAEVRVELSSESGPIDTADVKYDGQTCAILGPRSLGGFEVRRIERDHPVWACWASKSALPGPRALRELRRRMAARDEKERKEQAEWEAANPGQLRRNSLAETLRRMEGEELAGSFDLFPHPGDFWLESMPGEWGDEGASGVIAWALNAVRLAAGKLRHMGPIREVPPRFFGALTDELSAGIAVPDNYEPWLSLLNNSGLRDTVNHWLRDRAILGRRCELKLGNLFVGEEFLQDMRRSKPKRRARKGPNGGDVFALDRAPARRYLALRDIDGDHTGALHDVGSGVSQVLPVLALSLAIEGRLIAIEQPELHIHPSAQAELADVFIVGSSKPGGEEAGNRFVIETHSEHMILRVLRRIRETTRGTVPEGLELQLSEVTVVFVSPSQEGSWITLMPIDENGDFTEPWPEGFLPDRLQEL